jgi:hypothetical protein
VGEARSMHGGHEKCLHSFGCKAGGEDITLKNLTLVGGCRSKIGCEVVDWIHLAVDRAHWRAVVNTATNLP